MPRNTAFKFFIPLFLLITVARLSSANVLLYTDTVPTSQKDSITDTIPKKQNSPNSLLDAKVKYSAKDSIRFDVLNQKVYLYGSGEVTYENIKLNADYIELNLKDNLVFAEGVPDSLGKEKGTPVFQESSQTFSAKKNDL